MLRDRVDFTKGKRPVESNLIPAGGYAGLRTDVVNHVIWTHAAWMPPPLFVCWWTFQQTFANDCNCFFATNGTLWTLSRLKIVILLRSNGTLWMPIVDRSYCYLLKFFFFIYLLMLYLLFHLFTLYLLLVIYFLCILLIHLLYLL